MSTYRTDNHWGVTIVREGEDVVHLILDGDAVTRCCGKTPFELARWTGNRLTVGPDQATCPRGSGAELVAVVVNGDAALAERICALLIADAAGIFACGQCDDARYHRHIPPRAYTEPSVEDWDWRPADSCTCTKARPGLPGSPRPPGAPAHATGR